jgi:hypothetical protein
LRYPLRNKVMDYILTPVILYVDRLYLILSINTVCSLIKFNATVTSRLPAGTVWLTVKCYKVFPIRVKCRSIKTIKSTYLNNSSFCRGPGSDNYVQLYQRTHCRFVTWTNDPDQWFSHQDYPTSFMCPNNGRKRVEWPLFLLNTQCRCWFSEL